MNVPMTRTEWEALSFRDDIEGQYVIGQMYRARAYSNLVFVYREYRTGIPDWETYQVDLKDSQK